jgi:hypothetical protein
MKQTLEKILHSVKKAGNTSLNFIRDHAKIGVMLACMGVGSYLVSKANGAEIYVMSASKEAAGSTLIVDYKADANETFDKHDANSPQSPNPLESYSSEPGFDANGKNAKPKNTPHTEVKLRAKVPTTCTKNKIIFYVSDPTGDLEHRAVKVYDMAEPNVIYDIGNQNGDAFTKDLPDLVNHEGDYTTWHIATPALVAGDIASAEGVGILDGKRDMYDLGAFTNGWLTETYKGENFSWGDVNHDGINNMFDFATIANSN